jgi:ParB family chromosome partitioning protein
MAKLVMLKKVEGRTGTRDSGSISLSVKDIPIGDIQIKENVRKEYSGIEELAESIKQHGLLQPITVYPEGEGYIVKTGHRRFKAYTSLFEKEPERFHSIRCIISDAKDSSIIQLVENIQREDLSQIDLANALNALRKEGLTNKQIADVIGKTEGYINNLFMGVNEVNHNKNLEALVTHAGVSLLDVAETRGIENNEARLQLLTDKQEGKVNRTEKRQKVKELKDEARKAEALAPAPDKSGCPTPGSQASVKLSVSPNGLSIRLTFNTQDKAKLLETGIRRLLGRHQVTVVEATY